MSGREGQPLKDFQVATVDHVISHLQRKDGTGRYLVADEVGLGKTLVAAEVVSRLLEDHGTRRRGDIVYLCSNLQIARQNKQHLLGDHRIEEVAADRVTRVPFVHSTNRWRLLSLTPGTSFDVSRGTGRREERAALTVMLSKLWPQLARKRKNLAQLMLAPATREPRFLDEVDRHLRLWDEAKSYLPAFGRELRVEDKRRKADGEVSVLESLLELIAIRRRGDLDKAERHRRNQLIGCGRRALAAAVIDGLKPVLVIMDEFQRYPSLLAAPSEDPERPDPDEVVLARRLLDARGCRTLLLSATPYRLPSGAGTGDDHHDDLVRTVSFLLRHDEPARQGVTDALAGFRRGLVRIGTDRGASALAGRDRVVQALAPVMCRTERLRATAEQHEMLGDASVQTSPLRPADVRSYLGLRDVTKHLGLDDPVEYWKSAPAVANGQNGYLLGRALLREDVRRDADLSDALRRAGVIDFDRVRRYQDLALEHPGWRWLREQVIEPGAWRLLWIPPALPAVMPAGPFAEPELAGFTKRLVFSGWAMVPQILSALVSYEVERAAARRGGRINFTNSGAKRSSHGSRLDFKLKDGRPASMTHWGLLYPSFALADAGDVAKRSSFSGGPPSPGEVLRIIESDLRRRLSDLRERLEEDGALRSGGAIDRSWYWCAPQLLDWSEDPDATDDLLRTNRAARSAFGATGRVDRAFGEHVDRAVWAHRHGDMGPMPPDLPRVMARMALGGLGASALRAAARATGVSSRDPDVRRSAARIAWALRSLFTGAEAVEAVRTTRRAPNTPYWQQVADYAIAGNLSSALEELAVARPGDVAPNDTAGRAKYLADVVERAIGLRSANYTLTEVRPRPRGVTVDPTRPLRGHFAVRLGGLADVKGTNRDDDVRGAFNSPFWPFVLSTTSVGQEGLDFHPYCHAVVHWNLPSTPVDLEQREGRVHRYLGHAVRKNLAQAHGDVGRQAVAEAWAAIVQAAVDGRAPGEGDLVPWWVFTSGSGADARIDRYVPALPLSKDETRFRALERALGLYRITFGQPRVRELMAFLGDDVDPELMEALAPQLIVDLAPRTSSIQFERPREADAAGGRDAYDRWADGRGDGRK